MGSHLMAAERAKKQRLAAFAADHVDTTPAHDFAAILAFIRDLHVWVARTQHHAAREHHRRFWAIALILGD